MPAPIHADSTRMKMIMPISEHLYVSPTKVWNRFLEKQKFESSAYLPRQWVCIGVKVAYYDESDDAYHNTQK
jgi:hypothetical protein